MTDSVRRTFLWLGTVLLAVFAWTGIDGGISQFPNTATLGQRVQSALQIAFGLEALLVIATALRWQRWAGAALLAWTATVAVAAGMASVVWGGTSLWIGIASGVVGGILAFGIAWLTRLGAAGLPRS